MEKIRSKVIIVETVREVVNSNTLTSIFNIPATLRNRNVEVIIKLAADEKKAKKLRVSLKGCLKRYEIRIYDTWRKMHGQCRWNKNHAVDICFKINYSRTASKSAFMFSGLVSGKIASWLGEIISPVGNINFNS